MVQKISNFKQNIARSGHTACETASPRLVALCLRTQFSARHLATEKKEKKNKKEKEKKKKKKTTFLFGFFCKYKDLFAQSYVSLSQRVARFFLGHFTKTGRNVQHEHNMYQMVIKYPKWPKNMTNGLKIFSNLRPSKIYPILAFLV
jgi:exonuclease V gamma subunit